MTSTIRSVCTEGKKCYLLVVEDDPSIKLLLQELFVPITGIILVPVNTLQAAVNILSRQDLNIELVLLDLGLGDSSGLETLKVIADITKRRIAIIPLTGSTELEDGAFELGAQDFFSKPLQDIDVITRVKYAILRQRDKNEKEDYCNKLEQQAVKLEQVEMSLIQGIEIGAVSKLKEIRLSLQEIAETSMGLST